MAAASRANWARLHAVVGMGVDSQNPMLLHCPQFLKVVLFGGWIVDKETNAHLVRCRPAEICDRRTAGWIEDTLHADLISGLNFRYGRLPGVSK